LKKEKSCGCIVWNEEEKVLLVHMRKGHWSFPKGHVEMGETEEETAIRETKEETNIDILVDPHFREVSTYVLPSGVWKDVVYFSGKTLSSDIKIQEEEVQFAGFYTVEEAKKRITFERDLSIFEAAVAYYFSR